ncbi:MAG: T9SS type A sorting domain-containing protein, partial [Chitinophagales bacterium]
AVNGPCVAYSVAINFVFQSVNDILINDVIVSPNPNTGVFTTSFTITQKQNISIHILNMLGEKLYSINRPNAYGKINETISLPNIESGIYFLEIEGVNGSMIVKLLIN